VVIDVGAHCGSWMIPLSRHLRDGHVYSVEALPHYAEVLRRIARWMGLRNVTVINGAATERPTSLPLIWKDAQGRRLTGLTHAAGLGESCAGAEIVQGRPLDEWIPREEWPRVRLIKCDIEGAELAALRGARGILAAARPAVFCEVNDEFCRRYGHRAGDVFQFFASLDYRAFLDTGDDRREIQAANYPGKGDVYFVPNGTGGRA
jgi:FkbM family methyltransferase